ncbi:DUF4395 domain-containing protein [Hydrogenimonas thermophila]|uniref:DUF4395 domain-containing protein n=1 Tax=Hydrogenimonas thermophila TaxID=223786 RepID=A0A1I5P7I3_9BACT|nr:DUF4395 domain-containing protein [Hydrogenimonas thermophila]WOE69631.1 DUF4395 domain-containing protein [Hydrogenimonas thermophila]WOE72145.1 DUF4395 domain-containing protein [Hydrogenimonas thermophila]SFP30032.1 protein of unknown function [Hydrogenimonas thermophila]
MVCPISFERIDTHTLRLSGIFLFLFTLLFVSENSIIWLLPVVLELAIRAIFSAKYAPMFILSKMVINILKIAPQLEDAAPKRFAVRIGFLMAVLILLFSLFGVDKIATFISIILLLCIGLEVIFKFCVGCVMYGFLIKIKG